MDGKTYYKYPDGSIGTSPTKTGGTAKGVAPTIDQFTSGGSGPPSFTATTTLSPAQQQLLDRQQANELQVQQLGSDQIGRIGNAVSTPFSYAGLPEVFGNTEAAQKQGQEAIMSRLNPQFARDEEALRTRLINQGIGQGSSAYNTEFNLQNQKINDANQQAVLGGQAYASQLLQDSLTRRNQAIQEYTTQRNAPLNEYTALTSGQQIQNPQFQNTGYQGAQGVDYAGLVNQNYQSQLAAANAKTASNNSTMGSLFSLGGQLGAAYLSRGTSLAAGGFNPAAAATGLPWSDIRLKDNIVPLGEKNGHKWYEFSYKGFDQKYRGVMAQDVLKTHPDAVKTIGEYMAVDYDKLGLRMETV